MGQSNFRKAIHDGSSFSQLIERELGVSQPRHFARRFSASELLVEQMNLYGKLNGHEGCVNAVEFNSTGDLLISGSDDQQVIFWNWSKQTKCLSYHSGHTENIFQTKFMPFTDDRSVVTSAADGQVRLGQVLQNGEVETKLLGKHEDSVYKLAVEPGSPHIIYSCGQDGIVQRFDLRSSTGIKIFCCSSLTENRKQSAKTIGLNAVVVDPRRPNYLAVGGCDVFSRVYDIRKCRLDASTCVDIPVDTYCARHLIGANHVNITGLAYSNTSELLVSYNDELIYLFEKNMGLGPSPLSAAPEVLNKLQEVPVYTGHRNTQTIKGINFFGHSDEYVLSGSDCGHIFIWKKQGAKLVRLMVGDRNIVNQLEPHPHEPILATCGIEKNVKIWGPRASNTPPIPDNVQKIMECNRQGREDLSRITLTPDVIMHVLRLERRQTLAYIERRYERSDILSDEDEGEDYVLPLIEGDASSDEDSGRNSRDCNIS